MYKDMLNNSYTLDDFQSLDRFPDGTTFSHLDLRGSLVTRLPCNLYVMGNLDVSYTQRLTAIPEDTYVGGTLDLTCSKVAKLPANLKVSTLYLNGSPVTALPDGLNATYANLTRSRLDRIGQGVQVKYLALRSTNFLTHKIDCESVEFSIEANEAKIDLDCTNLNARFVSLGIRNSLNLSNLSCQELRLVRYQDQDQDPDAYKSSENPTIITLADSTITSSTQILVHIGTPVELVLTRMQTSAIIQCLVETQNNLGDSIVKMQDVTGNVSLDITQQNDELIDGRLDPSVNLVTHSLFGDLFLSGELDLLNVKSGLVYGDVTVPLNFNVDELELQCLGSIKYGDPNLKTVSII